jgi:hypothetical protein
LLEDAVPALLHHHLVNPGRICRSRLHVRCAEREKISNTTLLNARGQILL